VSDDVVWQGDRIGGAGDVELLFQAPGLEVSAEELSKKELRLAALQAKKLSPDGSLDAAEQKELDELKTFVADAQRRRIAANAEFLGELDRFERKLRAEMDDPNSPLRSFSRVDSALDVLRKVHQVQNENDAAFYVRGMVLLKMGAPAEARRAFSKSVRLNPRNIDAARQLHLMRKEKPGSERPPAPLWKKLFG